MSTLSEWESFYVILGSAAGALIGLQFVVMTLLAGRPARPDAASGAAFLTPTIVHFSHALLLSLAMSVPWPAAIPLAVALALAGTAGTAYCFSVARNMGKQSTYAPEAEDWAFHFILPLLANVALLASGLLVIFSAPVAAYGVAFAALILLFCGVHNAWDNVAYQVLDSALDKQVSGKDRA